ncbi:iron-siderophore ABC transporter substrate-binding protein [Photobacterium sp. MCCC 1A19761]
MRVIFAILLMFSAGVTAKTYQHELGTAEFSTPPKKVVSLDWVLTETLLTLDVAPQGIADVAGYREWVSVPVLPQDVIDIGSRREPNLELLAQIKPDVILMSQHLAPAYEKLSAIAPTLVYSVYSEKKAPYQEAEAMTRQLGALFDREAQAEQVIAATREKLAENGQRLKAAGKASHPLLLVRFIGDKHLRIHGEGSLAVNTLTRMGLESGWHQDTNLWGFSSAGMEKLAQLQQASVVYFGPVDAKVQQAVFKTPLWRALAFSREQRVYELPAIWSFGGLKAAERLSDQVTQLLLSGP